MIFAISGKEKTFDDFIFLNRFGDYSNTYFVRSLRNISLVTEDDTILLLPGWFAKSWAAQFIHEVKILYPNIIFDYRDLKVGEIERNKLQSERISSRFDILDL